MLDKEFYIISFDSTHKAIKTERELNKLDVELIPTPREISASCGLSLKFYKKDSEYILNYFNSIDNSGMNVYIINKNNGEKVINKIF